MDLNKFKDSAESFLKLLTIILGLLYILGIIIQSIAYDSLGIHESSFIQVRSIMIGVSFTIYVLFFFLTFLGLLLTLLIIISPLRNRRWLSFFNYGFLPSVFLIIYLVGIYVGFMTPWGRDWNESYWFSGKSWTWDFTKRDVIAGVQNVLFAFNNPKAKMCFFILFGFFTYLFFTTPKDPGDNILSFLIRLIFEQSTQARGAMAGICIGITLMLLSAYAIEIFPNIRSNMGGGQPSIVEIKTDTGSVNNLQAKNYKNAHLKIPKSVLWKQDEAFTYFSLIDSSLAKGTSVIAVKTSLILNMKYLKGYVRIKSGNQITSYSINENQ